MKICEKKSEVFFYDVFFMTCFYDVFFYDVFMTCQEMVT